MTGNARVAAVSAMAILLGGRASDGHQSFAGGGFDGTIAVHLDGRIVGMDWTNPHSWITVDVAGAGGETQRWALEGPSVTQLRRRNVDLTALRVGDRLRACGYGQRSDASKTEAASGPNVRMLSAELLTLTNGEALVWAGYGQGKCLEPKR